MGCHIGDISFGSALYALSWQRLFTVYNNISFRCVKEPSHWDVSLTRVQSLCLIFDLFVTISTQHLYLNSRHIDSSPTNNIETLLNRQSPSRVLKRADLDSKLYSDIMKFETGSSAFLLKSWYTKLCTGTFFTNFFPLAAADFSFFSPPLAAYGKKLKKCTIWDQVRSDFSR